MKRIGEEWAIVLAGGDGARLQRLTTEGGVAIPKQFCSLRRGRSLLGDALARAAHVVAWDRIVVVVAEGHRTFWEEEVAGFPAENIVVQPKNRGTAPGLLLPLLGILERDPEARVIVLPSDHYVEKESALAVSLRLALQAIGPGRDGGRLVLLGVTPEVPDTGLGWILSEKRDGSIEEVTAFVEKPDLERARDLMRAGGLLHSFIFVARASALLELFETKLPTLYRRLRDAAHAPWNKRQKLVESAYERMEFSDFSRDLLQESVDRLRVLRLPPCGWTDLGTTERVAACVGALGGDGLARMPLGAPRLCARVDLSLALARMGVMNRPAGRVKIA